MVNWGIHLPWVYVHSAICETYWVYWCSIDLCHNGWSICHWYMCILLYMKLIGVIVLHGSMLNWGWGQSAIGICAFFYICNWLGVMVLHRSMLIWRGPSAMGICAFCYMWNLWDVIGVAWIYGLIGGVHLPWVYVHSAICETYWV